MNKKEFIEKLKEVEKDDLNINDKVFRDFIKFFVNSYNLTIDKETFSHWNYLVINTTKYNKRAFTTQSDLWALVYDDYFDKNENLDLFKNALHNTMFKEQIKYLNQNVKFKDDYATKKDNKTLSQIEIHHTKKLLEWTVNYIEELKKAKQSAIQSNQINNLLTKDVSLEFFIEKHDYFLKVFNWHKMGFEIIIG
ncbi:hypothetical protein EELLY_v1c03350 [Entomoplasma ellychniae]|uniref:Uncharacterized protein n=1 Tax=Entomoplasma ellychniae TaxID=2114 RepID=A0A8E2QXZ4_9MOLU|nr:hypothetical protein [Entomoplasma ellychniae]PPE04655.1 hypothetical protein EELLY_v1c03350 [Entomoplasma ellychniae]